MFLEITVSPVFCLYFIVWLEIGTRGELSGLLLTAVAQEVSSPTPEPTTVRGTHGPVGSAGERGGLSAAARKSSAALVALQLVMSTGSLPPGSLSSDLRMQVQPLLTCSFPFQIHAHMSAASLS